MTSELTHEQVLNSGDYTYAMRYRLTHEPNPH
jgi:hypothetical protein